MSCASSAMEWAIHNCRIERYSSGSILRRSSRTTSVRRLGFIHFLSYAGKSERVHGWPHACHTGNSVRKDKAWCMETGSGLPRSGSTEERSIIVKRCRQYYPEKLPAPGDRNAIHCYRADSRSLFQRTMPCDTGGHWSVRPRHQ